LVELKRQNASDLQEQQDQRLSYQQQDEVAYQQHMATYQQPTATRSTQRPAASEADPPPGPVAARRGVGQMAAEILCQEMHETQGHLGASSQQNKHLQAQLSLLALSGEGDRVDKEKDEEAPRLNLSWPRN
jgi:hypothetical protein